MLKCTLLSFFLIILFSNCLLAESNLVISGTIVDSQTGEPLPGATLREIGTTRGVYTTSRGEFRLPLINAPSQVRVSSIGYEEIVINVATTETNKKISLKPKAIEHRAAIAIGEIDANNIIKRAIARKEENSKLLKNIQGLMYTKFVLEMGGNIFDENPGMLTKAMMDDPAEVKKFQMFVLETFAKNTIDYENNRTHSDIIQRRQTANMKPDQNLLTFSNFINFSADNITLINATFTTPLANNALSVYDFELVERLNYGELYVYSLNVIPKSRLLPLFEGNIKILEGTYNLVEINLKPSQWTKISLVEGLSILQKFEEIEPKHWHPSYMEFNGKVGIDIIKGVSTIKVDLNSTAILSEMKVNQVLSDTLFKEERRTITVSERADSTDLTFWENNSLRDISEKELTIYKHIDSLITEDTSSTKTTEQKKFDYDLMPYFDFNRTSSVSIGLSPTINFYGLYISGFGAYSFGLQNPIGKLRLSYTLFNKRNFSLSINSGIYSDVSTTGLTEPYFRLMTSAVAALFHKDYYDYYKNEGFTVGLSSKLFRFYISANLSIENHSSLDISTPKSIFENKSWRPNPEIEADKFMLIKTSIGNVNPNSAVIVSIGGSNEFKYELKPFYGKNMNTKEDFTGVYGYVQRRFNLINIGYGYISTDLRLDAGITDGKVPLQAQYVMPTGLVFMRTEGAFLSAPMSNYGGNKYAAGHIRLNLTDYWWRALRLPTYEGRGIDLSLAASSFITENKNEDFYISTNKQLYTEIGFGLSRIPTFVSNIFYLGFDARWGVRPCACGRFGWSINMNLPF